MTDEFIDTTEYVRFGTFEMTREALIVIFSGLVLFTILTFEYGFNFGFVLIFIGYLISAYKVNCMQVGHCYIFAKFIALVTFISVFYIIFYKF